MFKCTRKLRPRAPQTLHQPAAHQPGVHQPVSKPRTVSKPHPVSAAARPGVFDKDLSCGKEPYPVVAVNQVDGAIVGFSEPKDIIITSNIDARGKAAHTKTLQYITKNHRPAEIPEPPAAVLPAHCLGKPHTYIKDLNGKRLPYVKRKGVYVAVMQSVLYECGPHLGCAQGLACPYAITQRGCAYPLELRQTKDKGWALYTVNSIPAGAFVIEYTGVMRRAELDNGDARSIVSGTGDMSDEDAVDGATDEFAFDMIPRPSQSREAVDDLPRLPALHGQVQYVLDARHMGNVARFINHSCDPNLYVQPVLSSHLDHSQCNICLFAEHDITAGAELTFDYGVGYCMAAKWSCCCGADNCVAYREAATPLGSSGHLSQRCVKDAVSPVIPSQSEVPACASSHAGTSGDSTGSHNTTHSMRAYGSDCAGPSKKRKTGTSARQVKNKWGLDLEEFPELKQAALGQWPPRSWKGQEPTAGQAMHMTEPEAQLRSSIVQDTLRQELGKEANQKHKAIKKLLSLHPRTSRLKSLYIGWRYRGSNEDQHHHDQTVIQLHVTLQQLQADSINNAQVEARWAQHIMSLLQC